MTTDNTYIARPTALPTNESTIIIDGRYGKVHIHTVANWDGTTQTRYTAELLNSEGRVAGGSHAEVTPLEALTAVYLSQPRPRTNNIAKDIAVLRSRHTEAAEDFATAYTVKTTQTVKGKVNPVSGKLSLAPPQSPTGMIGGHTIIMALTGVPVSVDPKAALRKLDGIIVLKRRADGTVDTCPEITLWSAIAGKSRGTVVWL